MRVAVAVSMMLFAAACSDDAASPSPDGSTVQLDMPATRGDAAVAGSETRSGDVGFGVSVALPDRAGFVFIGGGGRAFAYELSSGT